MGKKKITTNEINVLNKDRPARARGRRVRQSCDCIFIETFGARGERPARPARCQPTLPPGGRACAIPRDRPWVTGEEEQEPCEWGRESQDDEAGRERPEAHVTSCYLLSDQKVTASLTFT